MTGTHYEQAAKWLHVSHEHTDTGSVTDDRIAGHAAAQAQAHATLALVDAIRETAAPRLAVGGIVDGPRALYCGNDGVSE